SLVPKVETDNSVKQAGATFTIVLEAEPGIDAIRNLRIALKVLKRRYGLRVMTIRERLAVVPRSGNRGASGGGHFVRRERPDRDHFPHRCADLAWVLLPQEVRNFVRLSRPSAQDTGGASCRSCRIFPPPRSRGFSGKLFHQSFAQILAAV